jgi:hypothetical protein
VEQVFDIGDGEPVDGVVTAARNSPKSLTGQLTGDHSGPVRSATEEGRRNKAFS